MTTPVIAFFNNKGGVGKTTLVYHLSWMLNDLGIRVVAADLDPQANLTAFFLDEDQIEEMWNEGRARTVYQCFQPLKAGTGDILDPVLEKIDDNLASLGGDLALSSLEDELSTEWPRCLDGNERSFRVISGFWRILQKAGEIFEAEVILTDLGPNLGAINRAALIAADSVVIPMSPDLFSLQGLRNLGPTLRKWRGDWKKRLAENPLSDLDLPMGNMSPMGYVVMQHTERLDRPVRAYRKWIAKIPDEYRQNVIETQQDNSQLSVDQDKYCLALVKHYRSLIPLAQESRKPLFHLKAADGAIGAHYQTVLKAYDEFKSLALKIIPTKAG